MTHIKEETGKSSPYSDYTAYVRAGVRIPEAAKTFSLLQTVQTWYGAHPATYYGYLGFFPGVSYRKVKLVIQLYLASSSDIILHSAIYMPSWCGQRQL